MIAERDLIEMPNFYAGTRGRGAGAAGALMAALVMILSGCHSGGGPPQRPPATVTVMRPVQEEVTDSEDYAGRLESPESTEIQARVSGLVTETPFKEGALVHQGDVLFVIDDRPFKADLDNKKATVAKDLAQVALTKAQIDRSQRLLNTHVIDQQDFDTAKANYDQAVAQVAADEAAQETSELNLEWTRVRAPITGLVSKIDVTVGNVITGGVGSGSLGTQLTTLVSVDPIYCYVPVPERTLLKYQTYARSRGETVRDAKIACAIQLENETGFPHKGVVDFVDNSVDSATGTVQVRGVFPNPDEFLTPGLFARMRIEGSAPYKALLVPDAAVGTDQNERYLLVVDGSGAVQTKPIELGSLFGTMRVITKGIAADDRVIVDGLQMAIPGSHVNAVEAAATPAASASPAASGTGSGP